MGARSGLALLLAAVVLLCRLPARCSADHTISLSSGPALCVDFTSAPAAATATCAFVPSCKLSLFSSAAKACQSVGAQVCARTQLLQGALSARVQGAVNCVLNKATHFVWTNNACNNGHIIANSDGQIPTCIAAGALQYNYACCLTYSVVLPSAAPSAVTGAPSHATTTMAPSHVTTTMTPSHATTTMAPSHATTTGRPAPPSPAPHTKPPVATGNILMLIIDDSRPDFAKAYSSLDAITPNLDKVAANPRTVIFNKAFASFAMCAPSRASFLFGRSPFVTQVLNNNNLGTRQAPAAAGWASVFQLFRNQGYVTYAGGKVFHADDPPSFTNVYNPNNVGETGDDCLGDSKAHFFPHVPAFAVCRTAMPINTLPDFVTANRAVQQLRAHVAANASAKFFLAAGFLKPHTPLHVQTQFFNLFGTGLPFNGVRELGSAVIRPVSSMSEYYFDRWSEIRGSKGTMQFTPYDPTTIQFRITARAGYLAALAQTDAACGLVLNELGALGLTDTTMVIVTSDHGYFLGEHNMWAKNTNFDKSLHVPLMMKIPWLQPAGPAYINGFFEHLDLYRTTAGLFGLSSFVAADVEGFDHSANIKAALTAARSPLAPTLPWSRDASYAQVVRCAFADRCQNLVSSVTVQGFTIRTAKWRYSIFVNSTGITPMFGRLLAEELYDHSADTSTALQDEAVNLAAQQPQVCSSLRALLQQRFGGSSLPV